MNVSRYNRLTTVRINNEIPIQYVPVPTEQDYTTGFIIRYFIQQRDTPGSPIFEISHDTYNRYTSIDYYMGVVLSWRITGELEDKWINNVYYPSVLTSNKLSINKAARNMPDIKLYLVNLRQYWKQTI